MKTQRILSIVIVALCLVIPPVQAIAQNAKVLVPQSSWNCGMAEGIPSPESGALIFEAEMKLERVANIGKTPYGERQVAVVQDGTLLGTKLSGSVMPGALDLELILSNGTIEIEQFFVLKTSDGKYVYVHAAGTGAGANDVRVVMDFEAPNAGSFAWLNSGKYLARRVVNAAAKTMTMRIYDVTGVTPDPDPADIVRISKPSGVPSQPWNFRKADPGEKQGSVTDHGNGHVESQSIRWSEQTGKSKHNPDHWRRIERAYSGQGALRWSGLSEPVRSSGYRRALSVAGQRWRHHHRSKHRIRRFGADLRGADR